MSYRQKRHWEAVYLLGTMLQMAIVCGIEAMLEINHIQYGKIVELLFLGVGGTSSALWGIIVAKKSGRISSYKQVLRDFLSIKASIRLYGLIVLFWVIIFGYPIVTGKLIEGVKWHTFILFFVQAIIFGGIEEIGWRYTFQPMVEMHVSFECASMITFMWWGIWHYMYFYITDSLTAIEHSTFIIGLLGSCFILGAIYRISQNLWLCVMYHCLFNMFSQAMLPNTLIETILYNVIGILIAIIVVRSKGINAILKDDHIIKIGRHY